MKINKFIYCYILILFKVLIVYSVPINKNLLKRTPGPFEFENVSFKFYFKKPENWDEKIYAYVYPISNKGIHTMKWPGTEMNKVNDHYTLRLINKHFIDSKVIFTDGKNQIPGVLHEGFSFVKEAVYNQNGIIGIGYEELDGTLKYGNIANIYYRPAKNDIWGKNISFGSTTIYAHYKIGNGEWNSIPGDKMLYSMFIEVFSISIDLGDAENITICFTDGKGHWDNNNSKNYRLKKFSNFYIDNYNIVSSPDDF